MPQNVKDTSSIDTLIEYAGTRVGAFAGSKEFNDLAPPFESLLPKLRKKRDERDDVRIARRIATVRYQVEDVSWDFLVKKIGALAKVQHSPDAPAPIEKLFGDTKPSDATDLGPAKAVVFGRTLVQDIQTLGISSLAGLAVELEFANGALEKAAADRTAAVIAEAALDAVRVMLVEEVNALIDRTEAEILKRRPGRHDLARAYLNPNDPEPKKKSEPAPQ